MCDVYCVFEMIICCVWAWPMDFFNTYGAAVTCCLAAGDVTGAVSQCADSAVTELVSKNWWNDDMNSGHRKQKKIGNESPTTHGLGDGHGAGGLFASAPFNGFKEMWIIILFGVFFCH